MCFQGAHTHGRFMSEDDVHMINFTQSHRTPGLEVLEVSHPKIAI